MLQRENRHPVRRLRLREVLAIVAATAVGLGAVRVCSPDGYPPPYRPIPDLGCADWLSVTVSSWAYYLAPIPATWTLAVLALRLVPPRPRRRRLMCEPGMTGSCAAAGAIALGSVYFGLDRVFYALRHVGHFDALERMSLWAGIAVAAAWLTLALAGRWKTAPGWLDQSRRLLGIYWVSMIPLSLARAFSG
jgi:hypothetical protein